MAKQKTMSDKPVRAHVEPLLMRKILSLARAQRLPVAIVVRRLLWEAVR